MRVLATLIGAHSCALGILMLFAPGFMLRITGFTQPVPPFFPSQSGIFLVILGTCYLLTLVWSSFEIIILFSKVLAVMFLTIHVIFFAAPSIIWVADIGDALMLAAFVGALLWRKRQSGARFKNHSNAYGAD